MLKEIAVCLVLCPFLVNAEITEIMYNPSGGDNNREYVELIFKEEILMDGWPVKDSSHEDIILLVNGTGNSKINLIVEELSIDLSASSFVYSGPIASPIAFPKKSM